MRMINYIVIHCTATMPDAKVESIRRYWKEVLGWNAPGYHHIIDAAGVITDLLPHEKASNGVGGWNTQLINIAYIGGIDAEGKAKDTRTPQQKNALKELILKCKALYPHAKVQGHRDFPNVKKACPSFDAVREYEFL